MIFFCPVEGFPSSLAVKEGLYLRGRVIAFVEALESWIPSLETLGGLGTFFVLGATRLVDPASWLDVVRFFNFPDKVMAASFRSAVGYFVVANFGAVAIFSPQLRCCHKQFQCRYIGLCGDTF